jgi:hypothetical protein
MGLGTGHFTGVGGDLDVFIPSIWSDKINNFTRENLVAGKFFMDLSSEIKGGGDNIYIPNVTEMTANSKTNGSEVTLNSPTETSITLVVNTWYETSFLIEDREAQQVKHSYNLQEVYAKNAAHTTAKVLEDALLALFKGFSQTVGSSATNLVDSNIRAAIAYLDAASVPKENRAFFFHPDVVWGDLMAIDKYTLLQNTGGADPILKGAIGMLYGLPVYDSAYLPYISGTSGRVGALAHKDALVWAGTPVRTQSHYIPQYLGTLVTVDLLYGVIENRDTFGVYMLAAE